jgi:uncharacterized protein
MLSGFKLTVCNFILRHATDFKKTGCFLLIAWFLVVPGEVSAAKISNLYRAQVFVADHSAEARNQALQTGLLQVVDRVTGSSDWRLLLSEQELLRHTQRLLEQYGYLQTNSESPLRLDVRFSGVALETLLTDYGVAVWGQNRPRILFWIAAEEGSQRRVISENTTPVLVDDLEVAMHYWGVPGLMPLMDIEDNSRLNISDLWGFFTGPVEAASRRYGSDAIVMARVNKDGAGRWNVLWQLRLDGETVGEGQLEEFSADAWAGSLVAMVSKSLANIYSVRLNSGQNNNLIMEIKGIKSFRDYVDVFRLLENLAPVKVALPSKVVQGAVRFEISLNGNKEQLIEHLALNQSLAPTLAERLAENSPQLVYLWQP